VELVHLRPASFTRKFEVKIGTCDLFQQIVKRHSGGFGDVEEEESVVHQSAPLVNRIM
jgi:hypothetical protein